MLDEFRRSNEFICAPAIKFPLLFLMNFTFDFESFFKKLLICFSGPFLPHPFYIICVKMRDSFGKRRGVSMRHFAFGDRETLPAAPVPGSFKDHRALSTSCAPKQHQIGSPGCSWKFSYQQQGQEAAGCGAHHEERRENFWCSHTRFRPHSSSVFLARWEIPAAGSLIFVCTLAPSFSKHIKKGQKKIKWCVSNSKQFFFHV